MVLENERSSRVVAVKLTIHYKLVSEHQFRRHTKCGDVEFLSGVLETGRALVNERGKVRRRFQRRLAVGLLGGSQADNLEPRLAGGRFFVEADQARQF